MKLLFHVEHGTDPDPIVLEVPGPSWKAGGVIRDVRHKLMDMYPGNCGRIRVFLNGVPIQCRRTLGEQGVIDGSLLTVCWRWSEQQGKMTNCLTHEERREEYQKRKDDDTVGEMLSSGKRGRP